MADIDEYGRYFLSAEDAIDLLLQGKDISGSFFLEEYDIKLHNEFVQQVLNQEPLNIHTGCDVSFEEFHEERKAKWFIPWQYELMDMKEILLSLCSNDAQCKRVEEEYALYEKYKLLPLLVYMKYLSDIIKDKRVLIGVGRGSSVSSYCLYLLGIHKIDSMKYDLDYNEFLKGE